MRPKTAHRPKQMVQLEKIYSHPPERVWQALTDPQALAQWLLPNSFQPRQGHRFRFTRRAAGGKSEKVQCQVVEIEAPNRLAYTWQAEGEDAPTLVTWTLEPIEEGTRLRLEHIGPETSCALADTALSADTSLSSRCDTLEKLGDFLQSGHSGRLPRPVQMGRIMLKTSPEPLRCISRRRISSLSDCSVISNRLRHEEVLL